MHHWNRLLVILTAARVEFYNNNRREARNVPSVVETVKFNTQNLGSLYDTPTSSPF